MSAPTDVKIEDKKENINIAPQEQVAQAQNTESEAETVQEANWRKHREKLKQEREQKEIAEKRMMEKEAEAAALKAAMESLLNKQGGNSIQQQQQVYDEDLSEDERIEKKVQAAIALKEKQYAEESQRREQQEYPQRLMNTYNDFNEVCSRENLDYLEYHFEEIATPFKHMKDGYDKWSALYKAIKRLVPNPDSKKDQKKMENNLKKPQSISSPGTTQGGNAMPPARLDEAKRAENWKRMQKTMNRLG